MTRAAHEAPLTPLLQDPAELMKAWMLWFEPLMPAWPAAFWMDGARGWVDLIEAQSRGGLQLMEACWPGLTPFIERGSEQLA